MSVIPEHWTTSSAAISTLLIDSSIFIPSSTVSLRTSQISTQEITRPVPTIPRIITTPAPQPTTETTEFIPTLILSSIVPRQVESVAGSSIGISRTRTEITQFFTTDSLGRTLTIFVNPTSGGNNGNQVSGASGTPLSTGFVVLIILSVIIPVSAIIVYAFSSSSRAKRPSLLPVGGIHPPSKDYEREFIHERSSSFSTNMAASAGIEDILQRMQQHTMPRNQYADHDIMEANAISSEISVLNPLNEGQPAQEQFDSQIAYSDFIPNQYEQEWVNGQSSSYTNGVMGSSGIEDILQRMERYSTPRNYNPVTSNDYEQNQ